MQAVFRSHNGRVAAPRNRSAGYHEALATQRSEYTLSVSKPEDPALAQLVQGEEYRGDAAGADDLAIKDLRQKLPERREHDLDPLVLVGLR